MTMQSSIGVNLRVTAHSNQGGRKYMEDMFCVAYQPTADDRDLLYAYFGIFDGHGGREAAIYAKHNLMDHIVQQKNFWSEDDDLVLKAIRDGFISTHYAMWKEMDKWPRTPSGHPSTSGTTASIAFVRRGKLYIGHVGDSGIVLGYEDPETGFWKAKPLTRDHKPESKEENDRITLAGGKVIVKSGVPRVVWNRPRVGHKGPVRRSTLIDEIPFLAVARSLGDLWSYNSELNEFVVSPEPDVHVLPIDVHSHRCLILGTDGLWNMLNAQDTVNSVFFAEKNNEKQPPHVQGSNDPFSKNWINPSKRLVDRALDRWLHHGLRADNTSVVCVVVDPPGPPKVKRSHVIRHSCSALQDVTSSPVGMSRYCPQDPETPSSGYYGPIRGDSTRQREALLGARPKPSVAGPSTVAPPQSPLSLLPIKSTSTHKPPSSRTTRVSKPILKRCATRVTRAVHPETEPAASSNPPAEPAQPGLGVSAFYPVSAVSLRTLRENHRNEVPTRHENATTSIATRNANSSIDDVQIHEISSSSESWKLKRGFGVKRKGQKLEEPQKKRRLEVDVRRPTTRHSVAQTGLPLIPVKRVKKVNITKKKGKTNLKAEQANILPANEKSDNQPDSVGPDPIGEPLISAERMERLAAAKMLEKKNKLKPDRRKKTNLKVEQANIVPGERSDHQNRSESVVPVPVPVGEHLVPKERLQRAVAVKVLEKKNKLKPAARKKTNLKVEEANIVPSERSDNQKQPDSLGPIGEPVVHKERLQRAVAAKMLKNNTLKPNARKRTISKTEQANILPAGERLDHHKRSESVVPGPISVPLIPKQRLQRAVAANIQEKRYKLTLDRRRKTNLKAEPVNIVPAETSNNHKQSDSAGPGPIGVPLIPKQRMQRVVAAKIQQKKNKLKPDKRKTVVVKESDNSKRLGIVPALKNATKKQRVPLTKILRDERVVKKSAQNVNSAQLAEKTLRSVVTTTTKKSPHQGTTTRTVRKTKTKVAVIEKILRSSSKAAIRATRTGRK